ncbi:hypothetical protein V18_00129 [Escherichia phage V18]|uniref:HNH homing endonuclease n=1 Tax=Escherichia phage V18 TaxID=1981500 RepID=A0A220NU79_9CAUD|nr:virion structural protein [Escherichia phage V18]ASJ80479.1 hypothetical protein V18_00129 [Escherichia phage V18]
MFVKYVKTCLNSLGREHWYTLLEKGEILTKSGKITFIHSKGKDPSRLVIDDYVTGVTFEVSVERLIRRAGGPYDRREYVFDSVTEMGEHPSLMFRMVIRDMRSSIDRIVKDIKEPFRVKVKKFFDSKINILAVALGVVQLLLILHYFELLFK